MNVVEENIKRPRVGEEADDMVIGLKSRSEDVALRINRFVGIFGECSTEYAPGGQTMRQWRCRGRHQRGKAMWRVRTDELRTFRCVHCSLFPIHGQWVMAYSVGRSQTCKTHTGDGGLDRPRVVDETYDVCSSRCEEPFHMHRSTPAARVHLEPCTNSKHSRTDE